MNKMLLRQNKVSIAILMFLVIFFAIHYAKPGLLYTTDGGFREFGVGYRNKTVLPIWVISIVLAILCYFLVTVYVQQL